MSNTLDFARTRAILVVDDTLDEVILMPGFLKDMRRARIANSE